MLDSFEPLKKMTDKELLAYTKRQEAKNAKRFNKYCIAFAFISLGIIFFVLLNK